MELFVILAVAALTLAQASSSSISSIAGHPSPGNATDCCSLLHDILGDVVSYPGSTVYDAEQYGLPQAGYWTTQESGLTPSCRLTPTDAQQVAVAVRVASRLQCKFAVRGGGHTTWAGAANIGKEGFTIDLSNLNNVSVSADSKVTAVGGGARWSDVYTYLDARNLSVSGGREAPVGVGGLTTGGGKSFFASKYGFACDGVHSFEVVTGEGLVLLASESAYPDLFKALKGGSNNFGIVTTFNLNTFSQGLLWGGFSIHPGSTATQQFLALDSFIEASGRIYDPPGDVQAIISYVNPGTGSFFANFFTNTLPVPNPPLLNNLTSIQPVLEQTFAIADLNTLTVELNVNQPNGQRFVWATITVGNDATLFEELTATFDTIFPSLFTNSSAGVTLTSLSFQPLTKPMLAPGCKKNSLGLCPSDGNSVIVNYAVAWTNSTGDSAVNAAMNKYLKLARTLAKKRGVLNKYIYLNYAKENQNPIASYGAANVEQMRAVSHKYDPRQVFQTLVPGGFKLSD